MAAVMADNDYIVIADHGYGVTVDKGYMVTQSLLTMVITVMSDNDNSHG